MQKCFETRDIGMLQEAITKLPEDEAKYHLKRCVDSGLWVPDASKVDKDAETAESAEASATTGEASAATKAADTSVPSSSSDPKPNVSTEDVD